MQFYERTWGYPNLSPRTASSFSMNMPLGTCANGWSLWAGGWMIGDCGLATGYGWANGDYFDVKWVGEAMVFTGSVVGTLHAFVDSTSAYNNFCLYGTGWHVLLSGTLAFAH